VEEKHHREYSYKTSAAFQCKYISCFHRREWRHLVVLHVGSGRVELEVALDDLVHSSQEVLLGGDLPSSPNCEHASEVVSICLICSSLNLNLPCFSSYTPQLGTCAVGAETRDELPTDVALYTHTLGVDTENVSTAFHVW